LVSGQFGKGRKEGSLFARNRGEDKEEVPNGWHVRRRKRRKSLGEMEKRGKGAGLRNSQSSNKRGGARPQRGVYTIVGRGGAGFETKERKQEESGRGGKWSWGNGRFLKLGREIASNWKV